MKHILYKIFIGKPEYNKKLRYSAYHTYRVELKKIWNNEKHDDVGFEKMLRLVLVSIQIIFPGLHVRTLFGRFGSIGRNTAVEFFVLFKTLLPLFFLTSGLYRYPLAMCISGYLLLETLCYVSSLIFVSDMFVKPRSYRRNILMLSLNYLEICLSFAVLYAGMHLLGDTPQGYIDYIYFSIITATTVGFGDMHPVTQLGKILVSVQAVMVVAFVVLFLNFFGSKVELIHNEEE